MSVDSVPTTWSRHGGAAIALRVMAAVAPALVALAVSWGMAVALPSGPSIVQRLLWTAGTVGIAITAGALAARALRRTAPLAWLLAIDVAFPDAAPSRFATALRAGRTADLARDLRDHRLGGDDRQAAQRIITLAAALATHDRATRGHSERVRGYTRVIGEAMGVAHDDLDKLAWSGLLHDVGKLAIDPDVLTKPCRLDADEQAVMRQHPMEGARLAAPLMPWLGDWGQAIAHHHERWDGQGYPAGLSAQQISVGGRIVAVADAFEAMTARRPYNTPRTLADARQELVHHAGTQFDPDVVRALLSVSLHRLCRIALPSAALGALPSLQQTWVDLGEALHVAPAVLRNASLAVTSTAAVSTVALIPVTGVIGSAMADGEQTVISSDEALGDGALGDGVGDGALGDTAASVTLRPTSSGSAPTDPDSWGGETGLVAASPGRARDPRAPTVVSQPHGLPAAVTASTARRPLAAVALAAQSAMTIPADDVPAAPSDTAHGVADTPAAGPVVGEAAVTAIAGARQERPPPPAGGPAPPAAPTRPPAGAVAEAVGAALDDLVGPPPHAASGERGGGGRGGR